MNRRPLIIIPAFNEAANLPRVLPEVRRARPDFEVVVVDDGSHDDTAAVARSLSATVVSHPFNLGYGSALQTGYKYALRVGCSLLVQMDADGQHDAADVPGLVEPLLKNECDLVLGSRFLEDTGYEMGALHRLGRNVFRGLARLSGLDLTDPTSGFQAMNRKVLTLYASDFYPGDYPDVNVLLTAHRLGLRIRERTVRMSAGLRPSSLHGGFRSFYYAYRMLLAIWVASTSRLAIAWPQGDAECPTTNEANSSEPSSNTRSSDSTSRA